MMGRTFLAATLLALTCTTAWAGATDLQFVPTTSAAHDFNHAPMGQSFKALASSVKGGLFMADSVTFTNWLAGIYPGQIQPVPYPPVLSSMAIQIELLEGEGVGGQRLDVRTVTVTQPFMGFLDVDYAAAGVALVPGSQYTILLTDVSNQTYPNGVTGWVVPSVHDFSTGAALPPGAYADGRPILQGALVLDDAGIGDNAFEVIDVGGTTTPPPPPPPADPSCTKPKGAKTSKGKGTVTAVGPNYVMVKTKRIDYAACTTIHYGGDATAPAVGDRVEWEGFVEPNRNVMAQVLTLN